MKVVEKAKIVAIYFDPVRNSYRVTLDNGESYWLSKKALWCWGRIQDGRKRFDRRVKARKELILDELRRKGVEVTRAWEVRAAKQASIDVFSLVFRDHRTEQRTFQAIIKPDERELISVATFRHALVDPEVVQRIGEKVFSSLGIQDYERHDHLRLPNQLLGVYKTIKDLNLGVNFNPGDIYTNRAIFIGQWIELEVCTNPLIWLGGMLGSYVKGTKIGWKARILRLTKIQDEKVLETRITKLVKEVQGGERGLLATIRASKTKLIGPTVAETILKAFSSSYGIGDKIQREVLDEFYESNRKSLYDLAQATSYVAWSSQRFRVDAGPARARLSAIAAVLTVVKDLKETYQLCKARLEEKRA